MPWQNCLKIPKTLQIDWRPWTEKLRGDNDTYIHNCFLSKVRKESDTAVSITHLHLRQLTTWVSVCAIWLILSYAHTRESIAVYFIIFVNQFLIFGLLAVSKASEVILEFQEPGSCELAKYKTQEWYWTFHLWNNVLERCMNRAIYKWYCACHTCLTPLNTAFLLVFGESGTVGASQAFHRLPYFRIS